MNEPTPTSHASPSLSHEMFGAFETIASKAVQCAEVSEFANDSLAQLREQITFEHLVIGWKDQPQRPYQFVSHPNQHEQLLTDKLTIRSNHTQSADGIFFEESNNETSVSITLDGDSAAVLVVQSTTPLQSDEIGLLRSFCIILRSLLRNAWLQYELQTQLAVERKRIKHLFGDRKTPNLFRGHSQTMVSLQEQIKRASETDAPIFISGEPGTETERVAAAVHATSARAQHPYVSIHCSAHSDEGLQQRLFEHQDNLFTQAQYGSLFLNEIHSLSANLQIKLQSAIDQIDSVRLFVASTANLDELVKNRRFREDLFYQLNLSPIRIPPLRERNEDILTLAEQFAHQAARQRGTTIERFGVGAVEAILHYHWPGNVAELESSMYSAVKQADSSVIHARHLPLAVRSPSTKEKTVDFEESVKQLEADLLYDALQRSKGNISAAARDLGITARMVRYKVEKLNIPYEELFKRKA